MRILLLDAYNLMHRARFGFGKGEYNVVFNFFRGLRPIVEKFSPDRAYFVLEGMPKGNKELLSEYKANRPRSPETFRRQRKIIESLMGITPIQSILHEDYEADDVIYTLAKNYAADEENEVFIVSTDSDFIQIYNEFDNVTIWHPVKKKVVPAPDYDYLLWKSLRGDKTDNIPGIKGIGDKTAEKLVRDQTLLAERMKDPNFAAQQERNYKLIQLEDISEKLSECVCFGEKTDFDALRSAFQEFEFSSMTKEKAWQKWVSTFSCLES